MRKHRKAVLRLQPKRQSKKKVTTKTPTHKKVSQVLALPVEVTARMSTLTCHGKTDTGQPPGEKTPRHKIIDAFLTELSPDTVDDDLGVLMRLETNANRVGDDEAAEVLSRVIHTLETLLDVNETYQQLK